MNTPSVYRENSVTSIETYLTTIVPQTFHMDFEPLIDKKYGVFFVRLLLNEGQQQMTTICQYCLQIQCIYCNLFLKPISYSKVLGENIKEWQSVGKYSIAKYTVFSHKEKTVDQHAYFILFTRSIFYT